MYIDQVVGSIAKEDIEQDIVLYNQNHVDLN